LVIGGGALFAGFPVLYAFLFSAMYIPFMLFLMFIIFRAVSIEFRSKEPMRWWRQTWDVIYNISSIMLAFLLGVVLGNILQGMPIDQDREYAGTGFFSFLNEYALLVGFTTLFLFMTHGAMYLLLKTEGRLYLKLKNLLKRGILLFIISFVAMSIYTLIYIPHLSDRFQSDWRLFILPVLAFLSVANIPRLASKNKFRLGFIFSSLTISLLLMMVAIELYPTLIFSTLGDENNLDIYNAASSSKSLSIMLTIAAIGAPLVLAYTVFVYRTFWGKVTLDDSSY
jgi:cytochrome d ubiquinol oxidase subunit II